MFIQGGFFMFFVINKDKIYAFLVFIFTVIIIFLTANFIISSDENSIATSSGIDKLLPIYNVDTKDNKVAFTMNCAWNADDIDKILEVLDNNEIKITFFMVGDWIDKYPN